MAVEMVTVVGKPMVYSWVIHDKRLRCPECYPHCGGELHHVDLYQIVRTEDEPPKYKAIINRDMEVDVTLADTEAECRELTDTYARLRFSQYHDGTLWEDTIWKDY